MVGTGGRMSLRSNSGPVLVGRRARAVLGAADRPDRTDAPAPSPIPPVMTSSAEVSRRRNTWLSY